MSRSASGALLAWTDKGGLTSAERLDLVRIALRVAGFAPRLSAKLSGPQYTELLEALLPEAQRPSKRDRALSLARCVSVVLGGGVPEDAVLTAVVNKTDAAGRITQNAWQARARRAAGARARGANEPRAPNQTPVFCRSRRARAARRLTVLHPRARRRST